MGSLPAQQEVAQDGKRYKASWSSLKQHKAVPEWLKDAKFGIYTHWGPVTVANSMVPEGADGHYGQELYREGSRTHKAHTEKLGSPSEFGYHEFVKRFRAEKFDADAWAKLFKESGAKFAGPVAEHHDGFAMWDSDVNPWNVADKGPKKDITGQLAKALRSRGLRLILTFHHAEKGAFRMVNGTKMPWFFPKKDKYGTTNPKYRTLYHNMPAEEFYELWKAELFETIDQYQPDLLWHDVGLDKIPVSYRQEYLAHYFNRAVEWGKDVGVVYKGNDLPDSVGILDFERNRADLIADELWVSDDSGGTWFYEGPEYASAGWGVRKLIEIVSRNGVLLLNVPPKPDGTFSEQVRTCLLGMGDWLDVNGEAIYKTRPWKTFGRGFVRYTRSKDGRSLYVITMGWPESGTLSPLNLRIEDDSGGQVGLLGHDQPLDYTVQNGRIRIDVPDLSPEERPSEHAHVFELNGFQIAYNDISRRSLSYKKPVRASNVFQGNVNRFGPSKAVDGDLNTRWATDVDTRESWVEIDLEKPTTISRIIIREAYTKKIRRRIQSHSLQYRADGDWKTIYTGGAVGENFIQTFEPVRTSRVRLNIHEAKKGPTISEIKLYGPGMELN